MISRQEFELKLKSEHKYLGYVVLENGQYVYFRRPTQEEYDTFQTLSLNGGASQRIAFHRYVTACFVGVWPGEDTFDSILEREGPAAIAGGSFGSLVNRLAGNKEHESGLL